MYNTGIIQGQVEKIYSGSINISDLYNLEILIPINTGSTSTGILDIDVLQSINQNLQFQNDFLIFFTGFFIMFFAFILSFFIYSFFAKSYFFNKITLGKK